jgi:L-ribulose-5-phosphate 3-epimerase
MKSVISYWSIAGGGENRRPLDEAMTEAAAAGFDGIELAIAETGVLTPATSQAACARIRELAAKHGLVLETVASGISWGCCPTHPDAAVRERSLALHAAALERTAWLGAEALLYVPGAVAIPWDPGFPAVPYDQAVAWAREGVARLAAAAERCQVDLLIENVWNGLFYSPLEFAAFIDAAGSARVGAYFDCGNVLGYHQHPEDWIRILGARIGRVHVKDFKRSIGSMAGFCDLLAGDVPFPAVMAALRAIGYDKTLVAEMMPPRADLLATTAAALRRIIAEAGAAASAATTTR